MHLKNQSHYDTMTMRRIVVWERRWLYRNYGDRVGSRHPPLVIHVLPAGARIPVHQKAGEVVLRTTKLTGMEWISLTKQIHGAPRDELWRIPGRAMLSAEFALAAFDLLCSWYGLNVRGRVLPELPSEFPVLVPLRVVRPPTPQRDVVRERYLRVLGLEKVWQRRSKLAQTKLKKLRARRRYYEKQLASRKETE